MKLENFLFWIVGKITRFADDLENKPIYIDKEKRYKTTVKITKQKYSPDKWNPVK